MAENRRGDGRRARRERAHTIDRALARDHLVDPVAGVADALAVRAVLEQLSDNDRELAMLLAWDDLTLTRAAQVLGITPEAARTRWKRLRSRLAIALAAPLDSLGDELPSEGSIAFSSDHLDLETPA
jgi:RNA polymerase sigma-70 factor (ECF subfamily)